MKEKQKKICPWCGKEFVPNHAARKYCCDSHRMQAYHKRKGYKVVTILPEQPELSQNEGMKAIVNPQLAQSTPESEQKSNDFNAGSIGAATVGTMAGNKLYDVFTADHNKPATKGYVKQIVNELYNAVETRNQRRHKEIMEILKKGSGGINVLQ